MADEPAATRQRLKPFGQRAENALILKNKALATLSRQECFDRGFLTVQDLDDEELRYGRCRDETGHIPRQKGRTTELIPRDLYDEFIQEHDKRMQQQLRQRADDMIAVIVDIATDDTVEPRDRLEAAKYAFERVVGKTPETVNVNVKTAPWEELLGEVTGIAAIKRSDARQLGTGIVEAEFEDITDEKTASEVGHSAADADGSPQEPRLQATEGAVQPQNPSAYARTGRVDPGQDQVAQVNGQEGDRPAEADIHTAEEDMPQGAIRPQAPAYAAQVEPDTVHDVDEPFTQVETQFVGGDLEEDRFDGRTKRVANNEKPVYTEGDIDTYGHRKAESKSYAEQTREAAAVALRRKEARDARNNAKKQRKIARALGADKIKDEITGATLGEDGKVTFD